MNLLPSSKDTASVLRAKYMLLDCIVRKLHKKTKLAETGFKDLSTKYAVKDSFVTPFQSIVGFKWKGYDQKTSQAATYFSPDTMASIFPQLSPRLDRHLAYS